MHTAFSERLANLRKERGLTQKEAAEQLGISAALLSHSEKGIRECGLDFVCKAAAFYDVTCDYLLGASDARRGMDESFDAHETPQDKEFRTVTLFRAATMLSDELSAVGVQHCQKRNSRPRKSGGGTRGAARLCANRDCKLRTHFAKRICRIF